MLDFDNDPEVFRANVSTWIQTHCAAELRAIPQADREICWGGKRFTFASQAQRDWMEAAAANGMTAPRWPWNTVAPD